MERRRRSFDGSGGGYLFQNEALRNLHVDIDGPKQTENDLDNTLNFLNAFKNMILKKIVTIKTRRSTLDFMLMANIRLPSIHAETSDTFAR